MHGELLEQAAALSREGRPFVLATVVARKKPQSARPGSSALILPDGTMRGWVGGGCVRPAVLREARAALADGQPRLVRLDPASSEGAEWEGVLDYPMTCQGEGAVEVYLEPVLPRPALLVLGRTPVAQALVRFGRALGFRVTAAEPLATPELFADAHAVLTDWADATRRTGSDDWIVVATMGEDDESALEAAAASDARYIGLVASRKKGESLLAYLRSRGVDAEHAARIKFPAGLDIGAAGAEELALSIMAEIVALRRTGSAALGRGPGPGPGPGPAPGKAGVGGGVPSTLPDHPGDRPTSPRSPGGGTAGGTAGGGVRGVSSRTRTRTPTRARARPSSPESEPEPESEPGRSKAGTGSGLGSGSGPGTGRGRLPFAPAPAAGPGEAVDPVCGMIVEVAASRHSAVHDGRTFHFCCPRCKAAFEREPARYAPAAAG